MGLVVPMINRRDLRFFLGGYDLEMAEIRRLLDQHVPDQVEDLALSWGAAASAYKDAILAALGRGETPVLIELVDDLPPGLFDRGLIIDVDHHGARAGTDAPTSIEQIWSLLGFPADALPRRLLLVAANDRGHVDGLLAAGATPEEIAAIRAEDRKSQGVSPADEAEAVRAIKGRRMCGRVTVVETMSHTSSAIADQMLPIVGGPGYDRLLVVMPEKLAVFGDGLAIHTLATAYPGSWWGGDLPRAGFWGAGGPCDIEHVIERIRE